MTKFCIEKQKARADILIRNIRDFKNWETSGSREQAVELLTQMQQNVLIAGTVLEVDKENYHLLITELERLCEILYQISILLEDSQKVHALAHDGEQIVRNLQGKLKTVRPRKEIVFLPYQISMWDSLESVWLEALNDAAVDAYVVPIPHYDVMEDGSLGELHDQTADYPSDIQAIPYESYLMEERHPDVIFFHNPYDGCNAVTRVPESYYASQLKKCAEKLVYIPYFVSEEGGPSEHFCYMPGVLFADRVVVQPGVVYEKYCQVYTRTLKQNQWEGILEPADKKFLPLSSPKFDKVLNTHCEVEDLPEHWQKIIQKPDGGRKKIVLYDLTVVNLLNNNQQVLIKAEHVFELYRKRQDEAVLLWRPHPLLLPTINALRPQLKEAYLLLVQKIQEERWGIFDDTPDPNLAMALSDAYYGDCSSLLTTYRILGKPMKIQNVWHTDEEEFLQEVLTLDDACLEDNKSSGQQRQAEQIGSRIYREVMFRENA